MTMHEEPRSPTTLLQGLNLCDLIADLHDLYAQLMAILVGLLFSTFHCASY